VQTSFLLGLMKRLASDIPDERAHPPKGFTIDDQGNYIPIDSGLTPQEQEVILNRHKNKK
jgi:hypothetical protein